MTNPASMPGAMHPESSSGALEGRYRHHEFSLASRLWGAVVLVIGLWLFAAITLQLNMPRVPVQDLWPVVIILIGGSMLLGSRRRGE